MVSASLDQTVRVWDISGEGLGRADQRTAGWIGERVGGLSGMMDEEEAGAGSLSQSCSSPPSLTCRGQISVGCLQKHLSSQQRQTGRKTEHIYSVKYYTINIVK